MFINLIESFAPLSINASQIMEDQSASYYDSTTSRVWL